ncbi:MAG: hypothetical protein ACO2OR_06525, partial [Desulfurococcaceae archaeon]
THKHSTLDSISNLRLYGFIKNKSFPETAFSTNPVLRYTSSKHWRTLMHRSERRGKSALRRSRKIPSTTRFSTTPSIFIRLEPA